MRLPVFDLPSPATPHFDSGPRSISAVKMLRISVTDRCNFRCVYCMPEDGVRWVAKENLLSFEEIVRVVQAGIQVHGIRWIKLTGGEPTLRHGLLDLIRMLRKLDLEEISLTTNGMLLSDLAEPLKQAGLDRITISIDSLQPARFKAITRTGDLATVLRGVHRAIDAGFTGIKINCVTMRGTNDDEFADFARMTIDLPVTIRFIEYMPLGDAAIMHESERGPAAGCGGGHDRGAHAFVPETEVRKKIESAFGPLIPVRRADEPGVGPANVYRLPGNPAGRIGFISAMSAPFCSTCNRLRLTAEGLLRSCLFDGGEVDIRELLRSGSNAQEIAGAMSECVRQKPLVHGYQGNQQMSRIGG